MSENVKKVKLGNYISQIRGVSYKPTDLRSNLSKDSVILLRANNIKDGHINLDDVVYVDRAKVKQEQILRTGDILVCTSSGSKDLVGKAALVQETMDVTFGAFCKVIRSKTLYANFLGDYFQSEQYKSDISKVCLGININNLRGEHFDELLISAYDFIKQKEIAERLDKIDFLIDKRKQQLENLDKLIKSQFIEMFGRETERVPLSHYIATLEAGKSLAGEEENPNKVLKTGAVSYDYFDGTQVKNLPIDYSPLLEHKVNDGDILISRMNTSELVGAAAYVWRAPENTYIPDRLWHVKCKDCNPIFLWQLLIQPSTKRSIRRIASGTSGSMKNISKQGLLGIKVLCVKREKQDQFARFVKQTDKSKFTIKQSLEQLEILKKSLMQKYFG